MIGFSLSEFRLSARRIRRSLAEPVGTPQPWLLFAPWAYYGPGYVAGPAGLAAGVAAWRRRNRTGQPVRLSYGYYDGHHSRLVDRNFHPPEKRPRDRFFTG